MGSPSFQQPPYSVENLAVADLQEVIDQLDVLLPAIGWVLNASGDYTSPPNVAGQSVRLILTRISADELQVDAEDHLGRAIPTPGALIKSGTEAFHYAYGIGYVLVENMTTTNNMFRLSMMSYFPDPQNSHSGYLYFESSKTAGGGGGTTVEGGITFNFQSGAYDGFAGQIRNMCPATEWTNALPALCLTPAGMRRWYPEIALGVDADGQIHIRGRCPNTLLIQSSALVPGQRIPVPIDEATTAMMRIVGYNSSSPSNIRLAVRVPS